MRSDEPETEADGSRSEAFAERAVESSFDAIVGVDCSGRVCRWNPAAQRILGYCAQDALGRDVASFVPEETRPEAERQLREVLGGACVGPLDSVRMRSDGRIRDMSVNMSPVRDSVGKVIGAVIILRDLTLRKRAIDLFQLAVEASPNGMLLADPQGRILLANAELCRLFGYDRSEMERMGVDDLVPGRLRGPHIGHREQFATERATRRMGAGRRLCGVRKDGSEFEVEVGLNPIHTRDEPLVLAVVTDITERRQAEEKFRLAVEACPSGILLTDPHGRITLANAALHRMFGYTPPELLEAPVEQLVPLDLRSAHRQHRAAFVDRPQPRNLGQGRTLRAVRKDGSEFEAEIGLTPIHVADELFVLAVIVDVTDRTRWARELERRSRQLEQSNAELEQFAYVASHDLQEPLRMVSSFCQLLADRYADKLGDEGREFISFAVDGARRMQQLIQDLLEFSRVSSPDRRLGPVDSAACCRQALANLHRAIADSGVAIVQGELPAVHANTLHLVQLFQNLVGNAIKFRGPGAPRVEIFVERGPSDHRFVVRDNGIGIPPIHQQRIFQIFQRLHSRDKYSGTGIGLAICKRIVEKLGGRIGVTSAPGVGSEFWFTIPRFPRPPEELSERPSAATAPPGPRTPQ